MNLIQACEYFVRYVQRTILHRRIQSKNGHVCRYSGADADETVFNNDTVFWRNVEMSRCRQEKTRVRLPRIQFVRAEYFAYEVRVQICGLKVFLNFLSWATGRNTKGDPQRLDKSQRPFDGLELRLKYR